MFRDKAAGLADLLNWSHLVDSGIVLCKDGEYQFSNLEESARCNPMPMSAAAIGCLSCCSP